MNVTKEIRSKRLAEIAEMRGRGLTMERISKLMGLSISTAYNYIERLRGSKKIPATYEAMWDCVEARGICNGCILIKECQERWDNG